MTTATKQRPASFFDPEGKPYLVGRESLIHTEDGPVAIRSYVEWTAQDGGRWGWTDLARYAHHFPGYKDAARAAQEMGGGDVLKVRSDQPLDTGWARLVPSTSEGIGIGL